MLAHGLERFTKDIDIWLDPTRGLAPWCSILTRALARFKTAELVSVRSGTQIKADVLRATARAEEIVRISGLDMDVDVFFRPNNIATTDFEAIWSRAIEKEKGLKVPDEIDLGLTKMGTKRIQDRIDIEWLDAKVIPKLSRQLKKCSLEQANDIFSRLVTTALLQAAMENPDKKVRMLASIIQARREKEV